MTKSVKIVKKRKGFSFSNDMPTVFSHAVFAAVAGKSFLRERISGWFWLLIAGCAMIPDADVIAYSFGVERGTMFAHRGFTHSIAFAVIFGALTAFFAERFLRTGVPLINLAAVFALAVFSHPLLDMLTNGGSGVALFAPFGNERYFFPLRPIEVSPIGFGFFSERGIAVIVSEIIWLWLPALTILAITTIVRKIKR